MIFLRKQIQKAIKHTNALSKPPHCQDIDLCIDLLKIAWYKRISVSVLSEVRVMMSFYYSPIISSQIKKPRRAQTFRFPLVTGSFLPNVIGQRVAR